MPPFFGIVCLLFMSIKILMKKVKKTFDIPIVMVYNL